MAAGKRNIEARKKLGALYDRGSALRFGPDPDHLDDDFPPMIYALPEPGNKGHFLDECPEAWVEVWVGPPSPLQRDMALRDAQAARARAIINTKREEKSEEHLTSLAFLAEMSLATLVDYILLGKSDDRMGEATRDVLADEQWKDFEQLQDSMREFEEALKRDPDAGDDPEWAGLLERDVEYGEQIASRMDELMDSSRQTLSTLPRPELERKALEQRAELVGSQRFMNEYMLQMTFYSVRDPEEHGELFFTSVHEWAEQDVVIKEGVQQALAPFISDGGQAKNLPRVASGSDSSAPPEMQETSEPSTPTAATG